jgi:cytochrome c peroxidase
MLPGILQAAPGYIEPVWSPAERAQIAALSLSRLPPPPTDPGNRYAARANAAAIGKRLFFDTRLSRNGRVACSSCHRPEHAFADKHPLSKGLGTTTRNAPGLLGVAYQSWFFWDGRKDSLWSQALGPLESAREHDLTRGALAGIVARHYARDYAAVFGPIGALRDVDAGPLGDDVQRRRWKALDAAQQDAINRVFANIGKALAAYQRTLQPQPARFDAFADALAHNDPDANRKLTPDELAGLRLFIGPARCIECHNGPLFSNGEFHSTGVDDNDRDGRAMVLDSLRRDEFNCLGRYSDARGPSDCAHLRHLPKTWGGKPGAFKTPSLRNLAVTAPYNHSGAFDSVAAVLAHYNTGSTLAYAADRTNLSPLNLAAWELEQIGAFLRTLDAQPAVAPGASP